VTLNEPLLQQIVDLATQLDQKLHPPAPPPPPPPTGVTLSHIQLTAPEMLWYEARSASAPKTGPHGTIVCSNLEPSIDNFKPVNLGGSSDNVYLLNRLYPGFNTSQQAIFVKATKFSIGATFSVDKPSNVQQLELDMQFRWGSGVLVNMGFAWQPNGSMYLFDYVGKHWIKQTPMYVMAANEATRFVIEATCDGKNVQFTQLLVNGEGVGLTYSHPVSLSNTNAPYFNVARQYDGKATAPPYTVTLGNLEATFQ
jgi:hypothetical protein